ncbi:hypothetical protein V1525DRAFT_431570 [Lipomyces kononenkoae]|uniref:Uncharacterized protein n=1 Tax=Lipomyces kononenkoae TaxID=34357 RepID=A0ACC3T4Y0_LIPKO
MRLKLTIVSPASADPVRLVYPLPATFLSSSPTILDLVYAIHETFPTFFHDPQEIDDYIYGDHQELFRAFEYACQTPDGWQFCLWHQLQDTLRDEDHIVIRKLKDESNILACPRRSGLDKLTYPSPLSDGLRLITTETKQSIVTAGQKRNRDDEEEEARDHELPTAAAADKVERGGKRQKIEAAGPEPDTTAASLPPTESLSSNVDASETKDAAAAHLLSPPGQGSASTQSRNARRRRAKAARKVLEKEKLEQAKAKLLERAAKLDVIPDRGTTTTAMTESLQVDLVIDDGENTAHTEDAPERSTTAGIGIMDKIGSQIQSALSTLSQVVRVATPQPKRRIMNEADEDWNGQEEKIPIVNDQIEADITQAKDELVPSSASQSSPTTPDTIIKRKKPVLVIAEAVDCEDPSNRSLEIPPFPFEQVNLDEHWRPKYAPT